MKSLHPLTLFYRLVAAASVAFLSLPARAQSTYTWENSNITPTPSTPLDWFAGGPNAQGNWTGGDPVSSNLNTIQFFQDTTTLLTYTGNPSTQVINLNNGGLPFQLGTLTLNGRANTASNAKLTMTLSGDALNFSGATGTINLEALTQDSNRFMTYNINNAIELGTLGSGSVLTIAGNGTLGTASNNGAFSIGGAITELQGGGGTIVKTGSSQVNLTNASNNFSGPITISGGRLSFTNLGAWGGTGKNVTFTGNGQLSSQADGYSAGTLTVNSGVVATLGGAPAASTGSLTFNTTTGAGSVTYSTSNNKTLNLGAASGLTGDLQLFLRGNANFGSNTSIQFNSLSDAVGSALQYRGGTSDSNQGLTILFTGGSAPLVFNNRQVQTLPRAASNHSPRDTILSNNNASAANTWTINTDLAWGYTSNSVTNNRAFILGKNNTGDNAFNGLMSDGTGNERLNLGKTGNGRWIVGHTGNTFTGIINIAGGILEVKKLSDGGLASSIGQSSSAATNLRLGNNTTLRYSGTGDSSDRQFTINGTAAGHQATLDSSGTGALNLANTATPAYGTANQTRTLNLGGTNTGLNTLAADIEDNGTGAVSLTKNGAGTWVLTGNSTYSGATTINQGTLRINGSTFAGGLITVQPGAALGGDGTVGNVSLIGDAILAPGNSAGTFEMASLSLNSSSQLHFELGAPNQGAFPADSDFVSVQSTFIFGGELHLTALPSFGSPLLGDTWVLFEYQPGNLTEIGVSMASTPAGYGFTIDTSSVDGQVLLVTTTVPEPSTLLLFALGMLAVVRRLRIPLARPLFSSNRA